MRAIVEAAVGLAEEGGIDAVRLRDVASRAGVSMGSLYRRFDSKEDILLHAFAEDFVSLERHMAAHPARGETALDRVESIFRTASRGLFARPDYGRAVVAATVAGQRREARQMAALHARMSYLIHGAILGEEETLECREAEGPDVVDEGDLEAAAQALNRVWFAVLVAWAGGVVSEEEVISETRRTAALLLAGAGAL